MIGTRAHGKNKVYRYYTCFTRSRYDSTKCDGHRLNATPWKPPCSMRWPPLPQPPRPDRRRRGRSPAPTPYFVCLGRHSKRTTCTRQAILVTTVERLVEDHYRHIELSAEASDALAGVIENIFDRINAERHDLTRQKERLEDEQMKLLQAHYAGAIPLTLLKEEQDRISGNLDHITRRLDSYQASYDDAKARIRSYLDLATNARALYTDCDDHHRRLFNQAFFTKIVITENDTGATEFNGVYETILNPTTRDHAAHGHQTGQLHPDIELDRNEQALPDVERGRVRTSNIWWS